MINSSIAKQFESCSRNRTIEFASLATGLINELRICVFDEVCQIVELEFYLYSKHHPDPFVHRDAMQKCFARWYLHRTGGTLRNGSFKGLDLAMGSQGSHFGVLIRSLQTPSKGIVCGPCLCVDFLINKGGCQTVHGLNQTISARNVWDSRNPVHLSNKFPRSELEIFSCPRVGLSTKIRSHTHSDYGSRCYRYLAHPRHVKKGRPELIVGLSRAGYSFDEIKALTGSPLRTIQKYSQNPQFR